MKKMSETIVFFGSGPVAAQSLEQLAEVVPIEAIVTKPKQAHHRGDAPILAFAQRHEIPVHTPVSSAALTELFRREAFSSRAGLVIDYGVIISGAVIEAFPLGIVNSHFSLLPQLRGPDPIRFAILAGQTKTGVSLMRIDEKMDEGPLLAQAEYELPPRITYTELRDDLIELSNEVIAHILPEFFDETIAAMPQTVATIADSATPSYSKIIKKADGIIDWHKPAEQIEREIRAFQLWPKSRTTIASKDVVITAAEVSDESGEPGHAVKKNNAELIIYCGKKSLKINKLKPAGKPEMSAAGFLAGHKIT